MNVKSGNSGGQSKEITNTEMQITEQMAKHCYGFYRHNSCLYTIYVRINKNVINCTQF